MPQPSPRNKTLRVDPEERPSLGRALLPTPQHPLNALPEGILHARAETVLPLLPKSAVNLLFLDPPYNLTKKFGPETFPRQSTEDYTAWLDAWLEMLTPLLHPQASIYLCGDWRTSPSIHAAASRRFFLRNRITWEREKGRGARNNWKNNSEDIWFCTMGRQYTFNVDAVKTRRRVIAPYRDPNGAPKDWQDTGPGRYRDTHPANLWNDITIPFWSMAENTDHPTQKSEKLLARLILASSNPGDTILDPFAGSGAACVVAQKLGRHYLGIECNEDYCLAALKRLRHADTDTRIQGYHEGVFWDRNSKEPQTAAKSRRKAPHGD
ncbi:MAG: site-specific DNA-methyltransferase [Candidatus Hydrogenedentes bacterium]|nr:site-specific DNA-methyltransferase [Candidatus Hydrogenedentota bacterium]